MRRKKDRDPTMRIDIPTHATRVLSEARHSGVSGIALAEVVQDVSVMVLEDLSDHAHELHDEGKEGSK